MNLKTTVIDFYDDSGALLRELIQDPEAIPEFVKTAHVMTGTEDSDLYALVMKDSNGIAKKFPTYDAGNTWISSSYFAENYQKLPEEAQKVAAANLKEACEAFSIPVLPIISGLNEEGHHRIVDVEGKSPKALIKEASSNTEYALVINGVHKYPLNSATSVKEANDYFDNYKNDFAPKQRREYAVKVASVSERYGLPISDSIAEYSSNELNPNVEEHLQYRINILKMEPIDTSDAVWTLDKLASVVGGVEPEVLADALTRFDKKNGLDRYWGSDIMDPYQSVFTKEASGFKAPEETVHVGPHNVSKSALENLAGNRRLLVEHFGAEFTKSFEKDPVAIFNSMPVPQKLILINMANDSLGS